MHTVAIDEMFCDYEEEVKYENRLRGIRDADLFDSALNEPKKTFDKKDLYPNILSKASCYLRSFAINHPFHDGNKRTALLAAIVFLEQNGYQVVADNQKMYKLVEKVVKGNLKIEPINRRLKKFIKEAPRRKRKLEAFLDIFEKIKK